MLNSPDVSKTTLLDAPTCHVRRQTAGYRIEQQGNHDHSNRSAVEVESGDACHCEGVEKPAADMRANDAGIDVYYGTLARVRGRFFNPCRALMFPRQRGGVRLG
jgi:hypothetical protein